MTTGKVKGIGRMSRIGGMSILLAFGLWGCGSESDLFPLAVGNEWSYNVKNGLTEYEQSVKAVRQLPTAGTMGYELQGPMGISRLAWKSDALYASALPNARLDPPLPILLAGSGKDTRVWRGQIEALGQTSQAEALIRQEPESITHGSQRHSAIKTVINLKYSGREIELQTWYVKGIGPVRQVQRTTEGQQATEQFDVAMEYLAGP
jgi:hypothetical protein